MDKNIREVPESSPNEMLSGFEEYASPEISKYAEFTDEQIVEMSHSGDIAAEEYLLRYMEEVQELIQQQAGIRIDLSDPKIEFDEDYLIISIRGGFKALKVTVSASGTVVWDKETSTVKVDIKSVDLPVISVDPSPVSAYIQPTINDFIQNLMQGYEIRNFEVNDDYAIVEAMKR